MESSVHLLSLELLACNELCLSQKLRPSVGGSISGYLLRFTARQRIIS